MRFEDLLPKPLEQMTDEEIREVISRLNSDELRLLEAGMKEVKRQRTPKKKPKGKIDRENEFQQALLSGLKNAD